MRRKHKRSLITIGAGALAALALTLGAHDKLPTLATAPGGVQAAPAAPAASSTEIADLLDATPIAEIGRVDGYDRSCNKGHGCVYGPAWNDPQDHSGCDTRSRILRAQPHDVEYKPGTRNCKVIAGWTTDPYTGSRITLKQTSIDHIVPLSFSWNAGAWQWPLEQRVAFANDPENLLAVSASSNSSKQDSSLSEWLPDTQRCTYVARFLRVTAKYHLPISPADRATAVSTCPPGAA
ncbi:HNH endonuclease family protein [Mycobacterium sp. NPDC003449]